MRRALPMAESNAPAGDTNVPAAVPAQAGVTSPQSTTSAPSQPLADSAEPTVSPDQVKAALRKVKDPDLNLNIVDLGLVYGIAVEGSKVNVDMSLTRSRLYSASSRMPLKRSSAP